MKPASRTVVVNAVLPAAQRAALAALSPELRVVDGLSAENLRTAEVIFLGNGKFNPAEAPNLKWVQFNSAGIGRLLGTPLAASAVPVASASGAYSTTVAEMALALLLAQFRRLPQCQDHQSRRDWSTPPPLCGQSCRGRTVGIVGYGSIGREVGRMTQALGMRVLACKRHPEARKDTRFRLPGTGDPEGTIPEGWFGFEQIDMMFRQTDVAVIALPGTPATQGLLTRERLQALPAHAVVINVGRGSVVDESALVELLQAGRLAGACLDVVAEEPLPASSPLWTLPQVMLSPHIASWTVEGEGLCAEVLIENMRRHLAGKPLCNLIDFAAGY